MYARRGWRGWTHFTRCLQRVHLVVDRHRHWHHYRRRHTDVRLLRRLWCATVSTQQQHDGRHERWWRRRSADAINATDDDANAAATTDDDADAAAN